MITQKQVLILTLALEGVLVGAFVIWSINRNLPIPPISTQTELVLRGLLYCLPLLILNFALFGSLSKNIARLEPLHKFCDEIIKPLADKLDIFAAFLVSIAAGVGEELFFRGLVQTELDALFSSVTVAIVLGGLIFAVAHFGIYVKRYSLVAFVYTLIGIYFGLLALLEKDLMPVIIAHASYDFVALIYLRKFYIVPPKHPCEI